MEIRVAKKGDIAELDALYARSYPILLKPDYKPSVLVTALPLISRVQPRLVTCGTFYVVVKGEVILGAGGWTAQEPGGGRVTRGLAHIRHVATDHRKTRAGVGRALVSHIFDQAREAGMTQMSCKSTLTAVPFYQAMGFVEKGPIEVPLRPGITFPAIDMHRFL